MLRLIACVGLFFALVAGAQAAKVKTEIGGGPEGKGFSLECAHEALAGLVVWQGEHVSRIQLLCATPAGPTELDTPHTFDGATMGTRAGDRKQLTCPENSAVYALSVVDDHDVVLDAAVHCKDVDSGAVFEVDTGWDVDHGGGGAPAGTNLTQPQCDPGSVAIGVTGRVDGEITGLGLICDDGVMKQAAATGDGGAGNGGTPGPAPTNATWAAFAKGEGGFWGYAFKQQSENQASKAATKGCGGPDHACKTFWTTQAACVAFAMSDAPFYYAAGGGDDANGAEANALKYCQSGNAPVGACRVLMSSCRGN